jgi:hypothetical protein
MELCTLGAAHDAERWLGKVFAHGDAGPEVIVANSALVLAHRQQAG